MVATTKLKGFAGLGAMVLDVGLDKAQSASSGTVATPPPLSGARAQPTHEYGPEASGRSSGGRAAVTVGILAVVALVVLILIANSGSQSMYRPDRSSQPYVPPKEYVPTPTYKPTYVPAPRPKYDTDVETKPPFGSGLALNREQIRYCESQKIRVSAWQSALNRYSSTAINAFNAAVDDYNARCSNYRYYRSVLEGIRSEVEARRYSLMAEGRALAAANP